GARCDARSMTSIRLAVAATLLLGGLAESARALAVPTAGKTAGLASRNAARRTFAFRSATDPGIAPPFVDPTTGNGAALRVFVSSGPGQCHAEIALPAGFWTAIGGDGAQKGWRYRDQAAS